MTLPPPPIREYPTLIAEQARVVIVCQDRLLVLKDALASLAAEIELAVAEDADLRNETARKARRLELQRQPDYVQWQSDLRQAEIICKQAEVELQRLRDGFSVAKLLIRRECAQLEVGGGL